MLDVVLIDDKKSALQYMELLLKGFPDILLKGMFTNPIEAINAISELKPNAVFLDINMPELNGIDVASKILEEYPQTNIIFVTSYDHYAIEAFELFALDYILKPVNKNRLSKTIERLLEEKSTLKVTNRKILQISCLGRFELSWKDMEPIKWRTEKTKELFAFLLQNRGRDMSKEELLDNLWPEDDPHKAVRQLYNGIYYIRKALEEYGVDRSLICIGSNYNLKLGSIDLDIGYFYEFEKGKSFETIEELEKLEALYLGCYMEGEYYSWADIESERLSKLYLQCLTALAKKFMCEKQWFRAENYLLKAYEIDPFEQNVTELFIELYIKTGESGKAIKQLNAYTKLIKKELGIMPNRRLQELARSIKYDK